MKLRKDALTWVRIDTHLFGTFPFVSTHFCLMLMCFSLFPGNFYLIEAIMKDEIISDVSIAGV
jgi:hypothetical protein